MSQTLRALLLRRLALSVFLLLGITLLTFVISHIVPGDPVATMLGDRGTEAQITAMREKLGLDRPYIVQYLAYLKDLAHLDLGTSLRTRRPVLTDLAAYFPATCELATCALLLSVALGIPLGVLAATKRDTWIDHASRLFSMAGVSVPVFWLALLTLMLFYSRWDLIPAGGRLSDFTEPPTHFTGLLLVDSVLSVQPATFVDAAWHLLLPSLCLGYYSTATLARQVRAQMLEVLGQDYIRLAIACGLPKRTILFRYALKNALIPVVTTIGLSYGSLLSGAVLTETIFAWPGLGKYAVGSTVNLDFPALMGVTLLIAVIYSVVNLVVDLAYLLLDPRLQPVPSVSSSDLEQAEQQAAARLSQPMSNPFGEAEADDEPWESDPEDFEDNNLKHTSARPTQRTPRPTEDLA
jgi:peptide/nickel transport system permease protein